jgi:hypothetical protein
VKTKIITQATHSNSSVWSQGKKHEAKGGKQEDIEDGRGRKGALKLD